MTRLSVGAFGLAYHLAIAAVLAVRAARSPRPDLANLRSALVAFAIAAFLVYALLVTPYAQKRVGAVRRGVVLFDFLVGMMTEVAVVAVAALLYAIPSTAGALATAGVTGYVMQVLGTAALAFLGVIGTAMTEVLAVGNGAGFVGFLVLKALTAARGGAGASERPGSSAGRGTARRWRRRP